jgi:hypothetical protein
MPLFRVDIEKTLTDMIYVEAETAQDAERDAKELVHDLDFEDSETKVWALPFKDDGKYNIQYWTGGLDGTWEFT